MNPTIFKLGLLVYLLCVAAGKVLLKTTVTIKSSPLPRTMVVLRLHGLDALPWCRWSCFPW